MSVRTRVTIAVLVLLTVVGGLVWAHVHAAGRPGRPGDSVDLPHTGRPVVHTGRFQLTGGLSSTSDRRCVYFQPVKDPQAYDNPPVIGVRWPEGFEGRIARNGDFWVTNDRGRVVAREGQLIALAGRFAHGASDDECLQTTRIFEVTDVSRAYFAQ